MAIMSKTKDPIPQIKDVSGGYDEAIKRYCETQQKLNLDEEFKVTEIVNNRNDYIKDNSLEPNRSPEFIRGSQKSPMRKVIP